MAFKYGLLICLSIWLHPLYASEISSSEHIVQQLPITLRRIVIGYVGKSLLQTYTSSDSKNNLLAFDAMFDDQGNGLLAIAKADCTIDVYDLKTGSKKHTLNSYDIIRLAHNRINAITLRPGLNGQPILISANSDGTIYVWNALTGKYLQGYANNHGLFWSTQDEATCVDMFIDRQELMRIIAGFNDGRIREFIIDRDGSTIHGKEKFFEDETMFTDYNQQMKTQGPIGHAQIEHCLKDDQRFLFINDLDGGRIEELQKRYNNSYCWQHDRHSTDNVEFIVTGFHNGSWEIGSYNMNDKKFKLLANFSEPTTLRRDPHGTIVALQRSPHGELMKVWDSGKGLCDELLTSAASPACDIEHTKLLRDPKKGDLIVTGNKERIDVWGDFEPADFEQGETDTVQDKRDEPSRCLIM